MFDTVGYDAPILRHNDFRSLVQLAGTPIVPQALPKPKDVFFFRTGQTVNRRKSFEKPLEVFFNDRGRRLLKHDLTDPDCVRVVRFPPGKPASVTAIPRPQRSPNLSHFP